MAQVKYRPKDLFCKNVEDRKNWEQLSSSELVHKAIAHTQAEMACAGFGDRELSGATTFILMLLNLTREIENPKPLPSRQLTSYEDPLPKPQQEKK